MMGRTHWKLGILYYYLLCTGITLIPALSYFYYNDTKKLFIGMLIAAVAALLPDADCQSSYANRKNPMIGLPIKALEIFEKLLLFTIRIILCGILAYHVWTIGIYIDSSLLKILTIIIVLFSILGDSLLAYIPFIGSLYSLIERRIILYFNILKRYIIMTMYIVFGVFIVIYNFKNYNDTIIYLTGILVAVTGIFPHRTFLHSIEGFILWSIGIWRVFCILDYDFLILPFIVGYASHLYLADAFTDSGIPLSILPTIIKKSKIHKFLSNKPFYMSIYKVLNIKISLKLINTNTTKAFWFERIYVFILLAISFVLFYLTKFKYLVQ